MVVSLETPTGPRPAPWFTDFAWSDGRIEIRKTGVRLAPSAAVMNEIAAWALWLAVLWPVAAIARLRRRRPPAIWFAPERPRPWYLVRAAALWGGMAVAKRPQEAQASFYFDDVTVGASPGWGLNARCVDVSKSHVARVFEAVFGYPLSVDPVTAQGEIVEKSEKNGVHDGRVVVAPLPAKPGCVYQRLVDTTDMAGVAHDLRTPCAGGRPVLVWIKEKAAGARFSINNRRAVLKAPDQVFNPAELALIERFCAAMGADWAGLDILRDRDGRLYIVDVNKTDLGPLIALSWPDKIRSMNRLAAALERLVTRG